MVTFIWLAVIRILLRKLTSTPAQKIQALRIALRPVENLPSEWNGISRAVDDHRSLPFVLLHKLDRGSIGVYALKRINKFKYGIRIRLSGLLH